MSLNELETKVITLPVSGLVLTLSQSNWRISRRKDRLESEAKAHRESLILNKLEIDEDDLLMREVFYPVMAACVISGNCPSVEDCINLLASVDLEHWYAEARQINPGWFAVLDKIAELAEQSEKEQADTALKKGMTNSETMPDETMLTLSSTD